MMAPWRNTPRTRRGWRYITAHFVVRAARRTVAGRVRRYTRRFPLQAAGHVRRLPRDLAK